MYLRPCYRRKNGKRHAYWALMESYRTERGPRQRVVAYLGQLDERGRRGGKAAGRGWVWNWCGGWNCRSFCGGRFPKGERKSPGHRWPWCWCSVDCVTRPASCTSPSISTPKARWPNCWACLRRRSTSNVSIGRWTPCCRTRKRWKCSSKSGSAGFAGNRTDVTTVEEIVETMERRYGRADRIWVMDRGMVSKENIAFLQHGKRQYIVGTPKSMLKRFERELPGEDWHTIRDGLQVKLCPTPDGEETFVLCRSRDRREKEKAMHNRFEQRIEEGLRRITTTCQRQRA